MTSFIHYLKQIQLRLQQSHARRVGRNLDKKNERGFQPQWFLLTGRINQSYFLQKPNISTFNPIYPPENAFWADPFLWVRNGKHYVFFEDLPFELSRGRISVIELDPQGLPLGDAIPVLETPHHLSYPFLFEYQGELYMLPEQTEVKRVDLYRCTDFPHQWVFEKTLIDGIKIADPNMFEFEGRWWIFCAAKQGKIRINESLFAFYADNPLSTNWTAHSANPLVRDFSSGRSAGRIFIDSSGRLLRPSQDCLRRYGHGLNLNVIDILTPSHYQESLVWKLSGDEIGMRAIHHLDCKEGIAVVDAQRLIPHKSIHETS